MLKLDTAEIDRELDIGKRLADQIPTDVPFPAADDVLERAYFVVVHQFLDRAKHRFEALFDLCHGNPMRYEEGAILARSLFEMAANAAYLEKHWKRKLQIFLEYGEWRQYDHDRKIKSAWAGSEMAQRVEQSEVFKALDRKYGGKNKGKRRQKKPKWPDLASLCLKADDDERTLHRAYALFYPLTSAAAHSGAACVMQSLRLEEENDRLVASRSGERWLQALGLMLQFAVSFFVTVVKVATTALRYDMEDQLREADEAIKGGR